MVSKCRLCDSSNLKLYYTEGNDDQFRYYRCPKCKLVNYDLSAGFDQEKHTKCFIDPRDEKGKSNQALIQTYNFIKRFFSHRGLLFDIGCGNGRLLYLASKDGWKVSGIEMFSSLAKSIKKTIDIDILVGDFIEYKPEEERYDLIVMRHVLEHLPDPVCAMEKINRLLKEGGHALFEFPNTDSLDLRLKWFLRRNGIYRRRFLPDYIPHHCNEFCRRSFEFLLSKTGFRLIKWQTYSSKELLSPFYNLLKFGNKARALVMKASERNI